MTGHLKNRKFYNFLLLLIIFVCPTKLVLFMRFKLFFHHWQALNLSFLRVFERIFFCINVEKDAIKSFSHLILWNSIFENLDFLPIKKREDFSIKKETRPFLVFKTKLCVFSQKIVFLTKMGIWLVLGHFYTVKNRWSAKIAHWLQP